jgi:LEA14-like dessication related protein
MKRNWIYLLLIGGAFAYFYGKKKLQQSIQFTLESVKLSNTKLIVRLGMLNPTGSSATINSIVGSIYIKGSAVATVENYTKIKILPKSKSFIDLTVTPSGAGVFSFVKSLISTGTKNLSAEFKGNANIDGITIPLDIKYSI